MSDARIQVAAGSAIPVGEQGCHVTTGQFEIPQTVNSYEFDSQLFQWVVYPLVSAADSGEIFPDRTIAVDIYTKVGLTLLSGDVGDNDFVYYKTESYWDKEGTILADKFEIGYTVEDYQGKNPVFSHESQSIFCPITHLANTGIGVGSPTAQDHPCITLRFTRYPGRVNAWAYGDFRVVRAYLPSDDNPSDWTNKD